MVPRVHVQKALGFVPDCRIDHLVYVGQREMFFGACLVEAYVNDTHPPLHILLLDQDRVGQPFRVLHLFDEACHQEPSKLIADRFSPFFVEMSECYWTGLASSLMLRQCSATSRSMPGMEGFHAETLAFLHRNFVRDASNFGDNLAPMRMMLLGSLGQP